MTEQFAFTPAELRGLYALVQLNIGDMLDEVERCNAQGRKEAAAHFFARAEEARAFATKIAGLLGGGA